MSLVRQIETNPKSRSILKSIIAMAHELGMQLVAEEQRRRTGCIPEGKTIVIVYRDIIILPLPEDEFLEYLGEN